MRQRHDFHIMPSFKQLRTRAENNDKNSQTRIPVNIIK